MHQGRSAKVSSSSREFKRRRKRPLKLCFHTSNLTRENERNKLQTHLTESSALRGHKGLSVCALDGFLPPGVSKWRNGATSFLRFTPSLQAVGKYSPLFNLKTRFQCRVKETVDCFLALTSLQTFKAPKCPKKEWLSSIIFHLTADKFGHILMSNTWTTLFYTAFAQLILMLKLIFVHFQTQKLHISDLKMMLLNWTWRFPLTGFVSIQ